MNPVLEDRLRDLFGATTQNARSADDPAGRAIARARVIRKRRLTVASAAAVLLAGASILGLGALRPGPGTSPTAMLPNGAPAEPTSGAPLPPAVAERGPGFTGLDLDVRAGDQLWTTGGSVVTLPGVGAVTRAYRVPIGWVYGGERGVRLMLQVDGTTKALTSEGDGWTLDPAGTRISFVADGRLHVGAVTAQGLAIIGGGPVGAGVRPVGFVGDRVLVHDGDAGYGLFDPAAPAQPAVDARILAVLGPRADGVTTALVREAGGDRVCLARLAATGARLTIGTTGGCDLGLTRDGDASVRLSADGSHVYQAGDGVFRLIDVESGRQTGQCVAAAGTAAVWLTGDLLLAGAAGLSVSCRAGGGRDTATLPAGVPDGWQYVPRLGSASDARTK
ncbi:hypothetical protein ACIA8K_13545 [Catenuloplanes sp. NPDC051500]|uniref:hypothetical protein n=1 Tax=Catenuloplanes sp. NPDC051500 TaxID=3363959 RepID=UPI0037AF13A7